MIKMTARKLAPAPEPEDTGSTGQAPEEELINLGAAAYKSTTKGGLVVFEGMRKLILYMPSRFAPLFSDENEEVDILIRRKQS